MELDELVQMMGEADIILTEGYKRGNKPKIEVSRSVHSSKLISDPAQLIAVVSDIQWDLGVPVFGTLDNPVHASNLQENLDLIGNKYRIPLIIAVDACLGRLDSVGVITVGRGSLKPGAGVNKNLPSVGQVYITGVVNVGGFMEYFVLQNTRLNLVMRMAKAVAAGISLGLRSWHSQKVIPPWNMGLGETFEG